MRSILDWLERRSAMGVLAVHTGLIWSAGDIYIEHDTCAGSTPNGKGLSAAYIRKKPPENLYISQGAFP